VLRAALGHLTGGSELSEETVEGLGEVGSTLSATTVSSGDETPALNGCKLTAEELACVGASALGISLGINEGDTHVVIVGLIVHIELVSFRKHIRIAFREGAGEDACYRKDSMM
jgi:hypothetical protein